MSAFGQLRSLTTGINELRCCAALKHARVNKYASVQLVLLSHFLARSHSEKQQSLSLC